MAFDLTGFLSGLASPGSAADNYFQTRELKKRLKIEQEAKDAAADKAKEDERMDIAAAVGREEVIPADKTEDIVNPMTGSTIPGVETPALVRPSYTNAAMLQAQRTAAPVQTAANQFTTARATAPYAKDLGTTSAEAALSSNRAADLQQQVAQSNAKIELGAEPQRVAKYHASTARDIAQAEAGVSAAENEKEKNIQELKVGLPELMAKFNVGEAQRRIRESTAQMDAGVPEAQAGAAAAKGKLEEQDATQTKELEKLYPEEMQVFRSANAEAKLKILTAAAAKSGNERLLSLAKSGALKDAIDPKTGEVDWAKMAANGISKKELLQISVGLLRGGTGMQNWLLDNMPDQFGIGSENGWGTSFKTPPPRRDTTATTKVGQKTSPFDAMKSR